MENTALRGVVPPLLTPLTAAETLDEAAYRRLIDHVIAHGAGGVFAMGTCGEAMSVSEAVWRRANAVALDAAKGRVPVLSGAIAPSTAAALEKIHILEEMGAQYAVVTPPFYMPNHSQGELVRHYETIAKRTKLPIVVYNIPPMAHVNITAETMRAIAALDAVVAYKDSCGDWTQLQADLFLLKDAGIALFNGMEDYCAAAMAFGADGCVPGLANAFPALFVEIGESAQKGDLRKALELQRKAYELRLELFAGEPWIGGMKYLLHQMGIGAAVAACPGDLPSPEGRRRIEAVLAREGNPKIA